MIRILSLVMPLPFFSRIQWFLIIAIPIYLACIVYIVQQRIDITKFGLKLPKLKYLPLEIGIILVAIPFGYAEYLILQPKLMINSLSIFNIIIAASIPGIDPGFNVNV